jgi:hypothetical protein
LFDILLFASGCLFSRTERIGCGWFTAGSVRRTLLVPEALESDCRTEVAQNPSPLENVLAMIVRVELAAVAD